MENKSWERLLDSTVALAFGTLLLYLVAANYLRGYLAFYSVEAEWFSPSAFQLTTFGFYPIVVAVCLTAGLLLLQSDLISRANWWVIYGLWGICASGISLFEFAGWLAHDPQMAHRKLASIVAWLLLMSTPFLSRFFQFVVNRKKNAGPDIAVVKAISAEEVTRLRNEVVRLGKVAAEAGLMVRIITCSLLLWWLTHFSYQVGWATGTYDYLNLASRHSFSSQDHNVASGIIFTDGTSSLCFETRTNMTTFSFRNPTAGLAYDFAKPGYVFIATPSPATSTALPATTSNSANAKNR